MLRRAVEEIDRKKARLVKQLEDRDDPQGTIFRALRERLSELTAERQHKLAKLAAVLDPDGPGRRRRRRRRRAGRPSVATVADLSGAVRRITRQPGFAPGNNLRPSASTRCMRGFAAGSDCHLGEAAHPTGSRSEGRADRVEAVSFHAAKSDRGSEAT